MDGLNFKCVPHIVDTFFERDSFGSYIPNPAKLQMDAVAEKFRRQLSADTGFYSRLAAIYERTDVMFTDNPLGNTPTLGVGYKLFGKRPMNLKMSGRIDFHGGKGQNIDKQLEARERKIEHIHNELYDVWKSMEPKISTDQEKLLYLVEGDQVMTGGGFDNNKLGEVHKSGLHFITDSSAKIDYADTVLSENVVMACTEVAEHIKSSGVALGSIEPMGASVVRADQDSDGMFGYPVLEKGYSEWTNDLAKRLLIETGVSTSQLVGSGVYDKAKGIHTKTRVIDAGAYVLDNKPIFNPEDMVSLVILLARIQKHGWKLENGKLIAKDGKTRSVYPNAFIPALIEAMIMAPFNKKLQEIKFDCMPSLQDKPTRVEMIKKQIIEALKKGYDYLAADWSKYDASVKGSILATVIQLIVKPFINAKYHYWIDAATFILTYKYLLLNTDLASIWKAEFHDAMSVAPYKQVKGYTIFGLVDGLISGAKFTHVGGSLYGEVVIHRCIPRLLGYDPIFGAQAGDDTLVGIPTSMIDISSVTKTYIPVKQAAEQYGLRMNESKQIFHNMNGEVVKVFLQDSYHASTDTWGIGSIYRPADAVWVSERDKGLSVAEQLMAEIARMNQGADSPFCEDVVAWWLSHERYLGWMFKEYGTSAFERIIDTIGAEPDDIMKSIDVGSFTYGVDKHDFEAGTLPILDVMADVAAKMTFSSEDRATFLSDFKPEENEDVTLSLENSQYDDDDSIE